MYIDDTVQMRRGGQDYYYHLAVVELIWERCHFVNTIDIPSWRLRSDYREPGVVRIITENDWEGTFAESPKFVIHIPALLNNRVSIDFLHNFCDRFVILSSFGDFGSAVYDFGVDRKKKLAPATDNHGISRLRSVSQPDPMADDRLWP